MHKYLRAIGFSQFNTKKDIDEYLAKNLSDTCLESSYQTIDNRLIGQYMLKICPSAGVSVIGEEKKKKTLVDYYFPFVKGTDYTIIEECTIERQSDREAYLGVIDDYRLGSSLIFYLINSNVYSSHLKNTNLKDLIIDRVYLSALSVEGKIILPTDKSYKAENRFSKELSEVRSIEDAPLEHASFDDSYDSDIDKDADYDDEEERDDGFQDNVENNIFGSSEFQTGFIGDKAHAISIGIAIPNQGGFRNGALAHLRARQEDVYSIVDTSIIPWGVECDKYNVVCEIISVTYRQNAFTKENLIEMRVNALGLAFNIMINEKDLKGKPLPGRRFVGSIWLLGEIDFFVRNSKKDKERVTRE